MFLDVLRIVLGLILVLTAMWLAFPPPVAKCALCYSGPCLNSTICGAHCSCMKQGLDMEGSCYGVE